MNNSYICVREIILLRSFGSSSTFQKVPEGSFNSSCCSELPNISFPSDFSTNMLIYYRG